MNSATAIAGTVVTTIEETRQRAAVSVRHRGLSLRVIGTIRLPQSGCNDREELLALEGKKVGQLPRWAQRIVREREGTMPDWWDHPGKAGDVLIVEPYGLHSDGVRDLVRFADAHGLDFHIQAESQHFPTRTVCVQLWPKAAGR